MVQVGFRVSIKPLNGNFVNPVFWKIQFENAKFQNILNFGDTITGGNYLGERYISPGLVWDFPGTWELRVGAPTGLNEKTDNYRIITQLIYEVDIL